MLCPHCEKPFQFKVDRRAIPIARHLHRGGYSYRDIAKILTQQGFPLYSHTQIWTLLLTKSRQDEKKKHKNELKRARRGRPIGSKNKRRKK